MDLIQKVKNSLKWKRSAVYTAAKLGISLEKFLEIKSDILEQRNQQLTLTTASTSKIKFEEDLKNDNATLEYSGPKEIKTQEDLVRECNIDLTKWKITKIVHNSWGKEGNQNYQVKAWLELKTTSKLDTIKSILDSYHYSYTPIAPVFINKNFEDKTCAVLSLQDVHVGKQNIDGVDDIVDSVKSCVQNLTMRSYHSCYLDKVILVLGGDLLNADTFNNTTTSGTLVESNMTVHDMYIKAFDLMFWTINYLKQYCNELEVVYIPGNHDRLTSANLAYSLSRVINSPGIKWNVEYSERKVVTYGKNFFAFEHGDVTLSKSFFTFATQFAPEWGVTKFRTLYSGHYHKEKKIEYITSDEINGFTMRILPSLTRLDKYHSVNKWVNNRRGGMIELHSESNGPTGLFTYYE
jgi:hypothetical protein